MTCARAGGVCVGSKSAVAMMAMSPSAESATRTPLLWLRRIRNDVIQTMALMMAQSSKIFAQESGTAGEADVPDPTTNGPLRTPGTGIPVETYAVPEADGTPTGRD